LILRIDNRFWGNQPPSTYQWKRSSTPPLSSAALLLMKFFSENHSGDVNNHSGRIGFFIHFNPGIDIHIASERLFTCPGIRTLGAST
jgi:hypothetical protein